MATDLAAHTVIILRIEKFMSMASFTFILNQRTMDLPKGVSSEAGMSPSKAFLT